MLKSVRKPASTPGARIAIVASEYNRRFVEGLLTGAKSVLRSAGVGVVEVIRVPGAFEIPVVVAALVGRLKDRPEAVIALGLIWQGETPHAQHIGEAVSLALMKLAVETRVPVIHEVLLVQNEEQARARCLVARSNRGREAASTALAMVRILRRLDSSPIR